MRERLSFKIVSDLLPLRTNLAAFQRTEALYCREYSKIAIDQIYIDIGLQNFNMIIKL